MIFTLLHLHSSTDRPMRLLITAQSWEAVHLLMRRLKERLAKEASEGGEWARDVDIFDLHRESGMDDRGRLRRRGLWGSAGVPGPGGRPPPLMVFVSTVWQAASLLGPRERSASVPPVSWPRGHTRDNDKLPLSPFPKLDFLLIDEASQLPTSDALMVMDLVDPQRGRICAMGDHLQLPPIILGAYPANPGCPQPWSSLLDALRASLGATPESAAHRSQCELLDNHRMCDTLAQFCRSPAGLYPSGYKPCDTVGAPACPCRHQIPAVAATAEQPAKLCQAARRCAGPDAPERGGRLALDAARLRAWPSWVASALHPEAKLVTVRVPETALESELCLQLLHAAVDALLPPPGMTQWASEANVKAFCDSTIVVAPHHAQIDALKLLLEPTLPLLRVNTVEKMQGQEADLVVIMYGLTEPTTIAGEASFLYNQARINVALTRTRKKCVLLLTEAVETPELDGPAYTPEVQDGLALLHRVVRVCVQGSTAVDAGLDVQEPARGSRFVLAVPGADAALGDEGGDGGGGDGGDNGGDHAMHDADDPPPATPPPPPVESESDSETRDERKPLSPAPVPGARTRTPGSQDTCEGPLAERAHVEFPSPRSRPRSCSNSGLGGAGGAGGAGGLGPSSFRAMLGGTEGEMSPPRPAPKVGEWQGRQAMSVPPDARPPRSPLDLAPRPNTGHKASQPAKLAQPNVGSVKRKLVELPPPPPSTGRRDQVTCHRCGASGELWNCGVCKRGYHGHDCRKLFATSGLPFDSGCTACNQSCQCVNPGSKIECSPAYVKRYKGLGAGAGAAGADSGR
jgi:hypothetical protein